MAEIIRSGRDGGWLSAYENRLIIVLGFGYGLAFADRLSISFLAPFLIDDLKLSSYELGLLMAAPAIPLALSAVFAGVIVRRFNHPRTILVAALLVLSIGVLLCAISTNFATLFASRILIGLGQGPILPLGQAALAKVSTPSRLTLNMALFQNVGPGVLGTILAPPILISLAGSFGWPAALIFCALLGLFAAAQLGMIMRAQSAPVDDVAQAHQIAEPPEQTGYDRRQIFYSGAVAVLLMSWLMVQATFVPNILTTAFGYSPADMSVHMSLRGLSGLICGIAIPSITFWLKDRLVIALTCLVSAASPFALIFTPPESWFVFILDLTSGAGVGCLPLVMATIPARTVPPSQVALTIGIIVAASEICGGMIAPSLVGLATDSFGWSMPLAASGLTAWIAALFALRLKEG